MQAQIRVAAARSGVSERALTAVAERLGISLAASRQQVAIEDILGEIDALATRVAELQTQLSQMSSADDPAIGALVAQARTAVEQGDLDRAEALLGQARAARAARRTARREELQAQLDAEDMAEADVAAAQAVVSILRADYVGAATLYGEAAEIAPESAVHARWQLRTRQAEALFERGVRFNEPARIQEAIRLTETYALALAPREASPDDWAQTQNNLGNALRELGARGDEDALARSVQAFENALTVWPRDSNPSGWAMTQMHLGNALVARGDPLSVALSIQAYENALSVWTRENAAAGWARVQGNLAGALLLDLRSRNDPAGRAAAAAQAASTAQNPELAAAISALTGGYDGAPRAAARTRSIEAARNALTVFTPETGENWAVAQLTLAQALAWDTNDRTSLSESAAAFEAALTLLTRARHPAYWMVAQRGLARALKTWGTSEIIWGEDEQGRAIFNRSAEAWETVISALSREESPAPWADAQDELADALWKASLARNPAMVERAVAAREAALTVWTRERTPDRFAISSQELARGYYVQERIPEARRAAQAAIRAYESLNSQYGDTQAYYAREWIESALDRRH
ncbi:MAG: hypothetical protein AB7T59_14540 [Hyphomonadaceae bacterium]